jgi:hypothetical protein
MGHPGASGAAELDLETMSVAAELAGDALRLGVTLPASVREWLSSWTSENIWALAHRTREWIETVVLPGGPPSAPAVGGINFDAAEWFDSLEETVSARDRAESICVGLAHAIQLATARPADAAADQEHPGLSSACLPALRSVADALSAFDARLNELAPRATIEAALGDRIEMLAPRDWTTRFDVPKAGDIDLVPSTGASPDLGEGPLTSPPDAVVARYVHLGLHARWVEGVAARTPTFRDELAALIGEANADPAGDPASLAALVWLARAMPSAAPPRIVGQRLVMAAASVDASPTERTERVLGRLGSVAAEAVLVQSGREFILRISASPDTLALVEVDGRPVLADQHGEFRQSVRGDGSAVVLKVLARDGALFEGTFQVVLPR